MFQQGFMSDLPVTALIGNVAWLLSQICNKIIARLKSHKFVINMKGLEPTHSQEYWDELMPMNDADAKAMIKLFEASRPKLSPDIKGTIIIFGTGGEMKKGDKDFREMFYGRD